MSASFRLFNPQASPIFIEVEILFTTDQLTLPPSVPFPLFFQEIKKRGSLPLSQSLPTLNPHTSTHSQVKFECLEWGLGLPFLIPIEELMSISKSNN